MEQNLVKITCPSCGAPIEENQLNKEIIRCASCHSTFQRPQLTDNADGVNCHFIPLPPSDEDYKTRIIEALICTDGVPTDIFELLKLEEPVQKYCPFCVFNLNWSADWQVKYSKMESYTEITYDNNGHPNGKQTKYHTVYKDGQGTSAGDSLVVIEAGEEPLPYAKVVCDYYNTLNIRDAFLKKATDDIDIPEGWTVAEAGNKNKEVFRIRRDLIKEYLQNDAQKVVAQDALRMAEPGWGIENLHFTSDSQTIGKPDCIYRPLRETVCTSKYKDRLFGAIEDVSLGKVLFVNLPQNEDENKRVAELDRIINRDPFIFNCFGGLLAGAGGFTFLLLVALDALMPFLVVFLLLFISIGSILLIKGSVCSKAAKEAQAEKESLLSNSEEKRREAAVQKFGSAFCKKKEIIKDTDDEKTLNVPEHKEESDYEKAFKIQADPSVESGNDETSQNNDGKIFKNKEEKTTFILNLMSNIANGMNKKS